MLEQILTNYINWDPNPETKAQAEAYYQEIIQSTCSNDRLKKIESLFTERVQFGTAGLRAAMGCGYACMNELVVLQTCQGLIKYLDQCFPDGKEKGVVFGYDHRKNGSISSKSLAEISAAVFLAAGYKVYMLDDLVATPFVPFAIEHLNCVSGVMVTASHNPKIDDGYKLYWNNGAQIIPPHDTNISSHILQNLEPWQVYNVKEIESSPLYSSVTPLIVEAYYKNLVSYTSRSSLDLNRESKIKVAYTPIHGIGYQWFNKAIETFNFPSNFSVVEEQKLPDPEFTTVSFPNPEENGAMDLLFKVGEENNCDLLLANDPDADRLAVVERVRNGDRKWYQFSGNQIGVLLGYWQIMNYKLKMKKSGENMKKPHVMASVVSSRMLKYIAEAEDVHYHDTLTGFKWLGNRAYDLRKEGEPVIFMYEEALGYCVGNKSCDKDGISAAVVFLEMATALAEGWTEEEGERSSTRSRTVLDLYQDIEKKYGQIIMNNWYVLSYDKKVTDEIFNRLRTQGNNSDRKFKNYITNVKNVKVKEIVDVTLGYNSSSSSNSLPLTPDSHMIMYNFDNNVSITLRTSGTEPKIKYYSEIRGDNTRTAEELEVLLSNFIQDIIEEFLQPSINNLVIKPKK